MDGAQREISFLREYRKRLITDLVTGKLDVREAVRHISDEPDDSELLRESDEFAPGESETDLDSTEVEEEVLA